MSGLPGLWNKTSPKKSVWVNYSFNFRCALSNLMSSVCYCTPLSFLLMSGDWLQGGDQKDGVALIQRKVVVPSYQVVSYITIQLSSQWKHGPGLKEFWPLSQVSAPTAALFQWNRVGEKSVCLFLTISLLSALSGLVKTNSRAEQRSFIP